MAGSDQPVPLRPAERDFVLTTDTMGSVLSRLDGQLRDDVLAAMTRLRVPAGDVVLRAGAPADALHVVVQGALRVRLTDPDADHDGDALVGRGATVGEEGLLTLAPRSATVVAHRDTVLARLDESAFDTLLRRSPRAVVAAFTQPVVARLRDSEDEHAHGARRAVVALVPINAGVPLRTLADGFAHALRSCGDVTARVVDFHDCTAEIGKRGGGPTDGLDDPRVSAWLDALETGCDHLLLVAGTDADAEAGQAWTERCVRQADVVVLVAAADQSPTPSARETRLAALRPTTRRMLLLLHPAETPHPRHTATWLAQRDVASHHHVRAGHAEDLARAARLVGGRGRGLVLGGGGARALAQLGVAAVLTERDQQPDALAAASAGAITAALLAADVDPIEAVGRVEAVVDRLDLTLPLHALTSGRNWTASLARLYGDRRLEDTWRPLVLVSTNLTKGTAHVDRDGPLVDAVRTTTAIPGLLPPVARGTDVLVDGGLVDNLPVGLLAADPNVGSLLAVEVGMGRGITTAGPFGHDVSGWQTLRSWLRPGRRAATPPTLAAVLKAALMLANDVSERTTVGLADHTVRPPVQGVGLLAFDRVAELAATGRAHAREALPADPWV